MSGIVGVRFLFGDCFLLGWDLDLGLFIDCLGLVVGPGFSVVLEMGFGIADACLCGFGFGK